MVPDEDDLYELNEDDAAEPTSLEVRPPEPVIEQLDADGQTYALGEVADNPPRKDLKILESPARWCLACGFDLTLIDTGVCPRCEKQFNPENPKTFSTEPVREPGNWWLQPPRLAGYGLLALFLLGRIIISAVAGAMSQGLQGGTGQTRSSAMIGGVVSALGVLFILPWIAGGVLLALVSIREHFAPKVGITLALGAGFGLLLTLGLHPAMNFIGVVAGAFAGFLYAWRQV